MFRLFIFLLVLLHVSFSIKGQTVNDLLRFSQYQNISSARSAGVAGAFGSLGADISIANINPAGIAEFRKSEIIIGANYFNNKSQASIEGVRVNDSDNGLGLGTVAGVFTSNPMNFDIKTMNIAIGINQLASFRNRISYSGSSAGTRVERFLEQANGLRTDELDPFEAGPAFDAEAILESDTEGLYRSGDFVSFDEEINRSEIIERSGSLNELFITVASNRKNKISWGLTLGIPIVNFKETKSYREDDTADNVLFFNYMIFDQSLDISGAGVNLKGGLIYKFTPKLRFGLALHTPSIYAITDNYRTDLTYNIIFDNQTSNLTGTSGTPIPFDYQITTPWRAIMGLSYMYKFNDLRGFISTDVEYVDYSSGSFSASENAAPGDNAYFDDLSASVSQQATQAINVKVGTEVAYKYYRVRAGVNLQNSPYISAPINSPKISYSAGLGYRGNKFYLDVAYTVLGSSQQYRPYRLSNPDFEPVVNINNDIGVMTFTFGVKI